MSLGSEGTDETQTAPDSAQPRPEPSRGLVRGTALGRYLILERLGAGGMGVVYGAFDPELDRRVALKLLYERDSPEARARLLREAQALARLTHPNVITVYDVGTHDDSVFVAMELVVGSTLTQWLREGRRPWREILALFRGAGRGLAAAHAAGLVHRDFKPDNVMVGQDGRVRVMDFGLAHVDPMVETHRDSRSQELTAAGARMGTPAYMAPEQHLGESTDARTDQFGFCVALYEGLYGERPFRAESLAGLTIAVTEGQISPPPRGTAIPNWLRRVIVRGLQVDPAARWPDMDALLAAIESDPGRRVRRGLLATVGVAGLLGLGYAAAGSITSTPCSDADQHLVSVWDASVRTDIEAAFAATGLRFAATSWERALTSIEAYTAAWIEMRTEACEATERGEQSTELLDLRMACLDQRLADLRATTRYLTVADAAAVEHASELIAGLGSLERCGDAVALRAAIPLPDDPSEREHLVELHERLATARLSLRTGSFEIGKELALSVTAEAKTLGYSPLLAESLLSLSELQRRAGDPSTSRVTLGEAFVAAGTARRDDLVARAWLEQLYLVGDYEHQPEEALRWMPLAEAALKRAGDPADLVTSYHETLGILYELIRDPEAALAQYREALAGLEALHGAEAFPVAVALGNLGDTLRKLGRTDEARAALDRAIAIVDREFGPDHPAIATFLGTLALLEAGVGNPDLAESHWQRSLALREQVLGPDHLDLSVTLVNLANLALDRREWSRALGYADRAAAIRAGHYLPGHPRLVSLIGLQARAHMGQGDLEGAEALFARAVEVADAAGRKADPAYLSGLGNSRFALGLYAEAVEPFERALELSGTGTDEALSEPLLAIRRFALAQALAASGRDRGRARALALEARAALASAGPDHAERVREVDLWLKQR